MNTATRVILVLSFLWQVAAPAAHGQVLDPMFTVGGYTTDDPIDPDRLGLATPDGRFAIVPADGCSWLAAGEPVEVYPNFALPPWLKLSVPGGEPDCLVHVDGRMSATPCFTDDAGQCDVSQEFDD